MPVASSKPIARRPQGSALPDLADDVVLPAVLRAVGDFERVTKQGRPIARSAIVVQPRQWREGPVTRSTPRRRSCPITTTISARPTRCRSSTTSPARASRNSSARWRIGARSSPSNMRCSTIPRSPREGAAPGDLQHRSARDGAPMVRRPRHHGVVGRPVAQRRLRQLDGEQDHPAFPSGLGRRRRPRRRRAKAAMGLDALNSTHPIVQQVRTVEQANQAFDAITYSKGRVGHRDARGFRRARRVARRASAATSRAHAYQNTRTDDLWAAHGSGRRDRACRSSPRDFTTQPGIPLIRVGAGAMRRRTDGRDPHPGQFSADRQAGSRRQARCRWHVPVRGDRGRRGRQGRDQRARRRNSRCPGCGPLLINPGQTGYFRDALSAAAAAAGAAAQRSEARCRSTNMA